MRRAARVLLWMGGAALVPALGLVALITTGPGNAALERLVGTATHGSVVVQGLSGLPNHIRLAHLELRDSNGAWLTADGVRLDWSPLQLVHRIAEVQLVGIDHFAITRMQAAAPATPSSTSGSFSLPVQVNVRHLTVTRADIGAPVLAGTSAALALDGTAAFRSLEEGAAKLEVRNLDGGGGLYALDARFDPARIAATLAVDEPASGLIAHVAGLPDLGRLHLNASANGPPTALASVLTLTAGPLTTRAKGTVNLHDQTATLAVEASAPAMAPAPWIAWQGVTLAAEVHGPFAAPDATGRVTVTELTASGAGLGQLTADLAGNAGRVTLHAVANRLRIPGPDPALLQADPLTLDATLHLDDPARPVDFTLTHPLISATGQAHTSGTQDVTADLTLARLAPFAAMGGIDLQGSTALHVHAARGHATTLEADGTLSVTGGMAPLPGLIGDGAKLGITARLEDGAVALSRLQLAGRTLTLAGHGARSVAGTLDAQVTAGLADLAVLAPTLTGGLQLQARATGSADAVTLAGMMQGEIGGPQIKRGPVKLEFNLNGLPSAPTGTLNAEATLDGVPLTLAVDAQRGADGGITATINRADWRSLHAEGAVRLPAGSTEPLGKVAVRMGQLGDLSPFIGRPVSGSLIADAVIQSRAATLTAEAHNAGVPGTRVKRAVIKAVVADPLTSPSLTADAMLDGIESGGILGSAKLSLSGPQTALGVTTEANLLLSGTRSRIAAAAVLDVPSQRVRLDRLQFDARGEAVHLLAPATLRFGTLISVDRLRLGARQAVLDIAGEFSPRLAATATLRTPASLAATAVPNLALDGTVSLDATLSGTPAQPVGTIHLSATGIRARTGPGRGLPPANLTGVAQLGGTTARIDARLTAGSAQFAVTGTAPLGPGALDLRGIGALDLALLNPFVSAAGRNVRGRMTLDAAVSGPAAAPRLTGTAQLTGGEIQDFVQGLRVGAITASLRADGDTVRIVSLTGRAGPGTIGLSGTAGILAPGIPLDLAITASGARPLSSDRLTATIDANLTLRGPAMAALQAGGNITVRDAEIRIPESLPPTVAALQVIRPGQTPLAAAPAGQAPSVNLDLAIDAPGQVFVRGRGVDAVMFGSLRIRGSATSPAVSGGLDMRRGTISAAGQTLTFNRGKVGFDGTGLGGKIDPTLDFSADNTTNGVTATLAITGYASAPKIKLSSVPGLPQDEVLSYLLFRRSVKDLGPFQLAEIAAALASLTGVGGGGAGGVLDSVRQGLGLDRLSVGGGANGSGASVEAGRYVANGVYVGAKQGTAGDTGATVQIDITKGLKLNTEVGTGSGGSQVGLSYQFEY